MYWVRRILSFLTPSVSFSCLGDVVAGQWYLWPLGGESGHHLVTVQIHSNPTCIEARTAKTDQEQNRVHPTTSWFSKLSKKNSLRSSLDAQRLYFFRKYMNMRSDLAATLQTWHWKRLTEDHDRFSTHKISTLVTRSCWCRPTMIPRNCGCWCT